MNKFIVFALILWLAGCTPGQPDGPVSPSPVPTPEDTLVAATPETPLPFRTSDKAVLKIERAEDSFTIECQNTGDEPLALIPPSAGWSEKWLVEVQDPQGNSYGLVVPPGPAFMLTPDRFQTMAPSEKLTATYKFSDFSRVERSTDTVESLQEPGKIKVAYVLRPDEITDRLDYLNSDGPIPMGEGEAPQDWAKEEREAWQELFKAAPILLPTEIGL